MKNNTLKSSVGMGQKIAFGFGMLANQMFPAALGVFIIVLVQDLGFAALLWGIIAFAPRIFDAVTDPLMGFISDNTKSKWGRRRQYVFVGGILMGLAYVAMWQLYEDDGIIYNFIYFFSPIMKEVHDDLEYRIVYSNLTLPLYIFINDPVLIYTVCFFRALPL
jgi:GPH family glycoside/pentoside/hexuronide:cation symporter